MSPEAHIVWHLLRSGGHKSADSGWKMAGKRSRRERLYHKFVWDGMSGLKASGASVTFTHYRPRREVKS